MQSEEHSYVFLHLFKWVIEVIAVQEKNKQESQNRKIQKRKLKNMIVRIMCHYRVVKKVDNFNLTVLAHVKLLKKILIKVH